MKKLFVAISQFLKKEWFLLLMAGIIALIFFIYEYLKNGI